ncbi:MAG: hypothetical protein J5486_11370 [Bacteroidaceae bacterium]|nr:hypothetical protein [Bacteroidaceae bacterium]
MAEIELDNLEEQQEETLEVNEPNEPDEANGANEPDGADEPDEATEPDEANASEFVSDKEKLMRSLVSDDDEVDEMTVDGFRQMLDAAPRWFLSQWKLLLLCLAGIFLYITNGYQAQVEMMKETELEAELKDWRYRSITRVSELTLLCRQSQLEQKLREQGDSTLLPSKVAPYIIKK